MSNSGTEKEEICLVIAGNVDSGKSTTIGVLTSGELDDGDGSARKKVLRHPHELEKGQTSDISTKTLMINNNKELLLFDLPGHRPYLKTALQAITGSFPDYGLLIIAANRGLQSMTKEHMGIFLYLNIPFMILITRSDLTQEAPDVYKRNMESISKIMKFFKRRCVVLNKMEENGLSEEDKNNKKEEVKKVALECISNMSTNANLVPVLTISNKTGYYVDVMKYMLSNLKRRKVWDDEMISGSVFYIHDKFSPPGIGLVVSGKCRGEPIKVNDHMLIGPYGNDFVPIRIWSIHNNVKEPVQVLEHQNNGCLAFRVTDNKIQFEKNNIRTKGMVIISKNVEKKICYQFNATIKILNHSTTISPKYTPVIHIGTVRQTARIILNSDQVLKMNDEAEVSFRFLSHPEFIEPGMMLFFREGTTRGVGTVTSIIPFVDDVNKEPAQSRRKPYKKTKRTIIKQANQPMSLANFKKPVAII